MKDFLIILLRALLLLLLTAIALEAALQLGFPYLPRSLTKKMPQFGARIVWNLDPERVSREFPAGQVVDFTVTQTTGDLYTMSCLEHRDAQPMTPYRLTFKRDHHGFRNAEPWPDDVDIVVLGDSFTEGAYVQNPFWQDISDSLLALGISGAGTVEQQRLFEAYGAPRKPETLVVAFFAGNDLGENELFAYMKRKNLTWYEMQTMDAEPHEFSVLYRALQWIVELTRQDIEYWCHYPLLTATDPPAPVAFSYLYLRVLGRADVSRLRDSEGYALTRKSLGEMKEALHENDGELILMYIPSKPELYWRFLEAHVKTQIVEHEKRVMDNNLPPASVMDQNNSNQRDLMRALADEIGIAFLDLTGPLAESVRAGQPPYFFADTHWNQLGHDIARKALFDFLNRSKAGS